MGEDNLRSLPKWKNADVIIKEYPIYVYPRKLTESKTPALLEKNATIIKIDAPIMELSSTFIRQSIQAGKNVRPMLPDAVWNYLDEMNFYK